PSHGASQLNSRAEWEEGRQHLGKKHLQRMLIMLIMLLDFEAPLSGENTSEPLRMLGRRHP
ncbi:MAG: hypothetical protein ACPHT8_14935, partial [Limisphaerales bacterium]